jgi:hypothetical protein
MTEKGVINSDTLVTYLTISNRWNNIVRVTVVHWIAHNSAGLGGSNALHGQVLASSPMLVKFVKGPTENLVHGLAMEEVCVASDALVEAYFAGPAAG